MSKYYILNIFQQPTLLNYIEFLGLLYLSVLFIYFLNYFIFIINYTL